MADGTGQQDTTRGRRPMTDPRLQKEAGGLSPLQIAALWAGYAAAALLLVVVFWLAINSSFTLAQKTLLGVTIALGVFWGVVHRQSITGVARARGVRLGANSVIFVFFVLGIIVLFNIVGARHHWRKDITEEQLYSLSEQTRAIITGLEQDLQIVAFLSDRDPLTGQPNPGTAQLRDRLREYQMLSPRVSVESYDPILNQEKAREYDIRSTSNVLIIKADGNEEKIYGGDEEQLTSAILAVTTGEKARIYFLTGHGELSIEDRQGTGLAMIKATLEDQQYHVDELNLATEERPSVPGDCAVLVIPGPTEQIRQEEMDAIIAYAEQGGNLLVGLEPGGPTLAELLGHYGVQARDGSVRDRNAGYLGAAEIPMVQIATSHRIVENLQRVPIALPTPRALEIIDPEMPDMGFDAPPPSQQAQPLLETSPSATIELRDPETPEAEPTVSRGPFTLAAVVDPGQQQSPMMPMGEPGGARMVVMGDAEMMTDQFINLGLTGNAYFVLNSINWLMENEKLITIPPKDTLPRFLTLSAGQKRFVWALVVGIIPIAIGIAGFVVWWRRR
ncbi:MAG: GldG family protein [Armatimonadota bacterium]|jgi:ABC-type uncharacterized transport system involved in gliding motility auxiliary subunit